MIFKASQESVELSRELGMIHAHLKILADKVHVVRRKISETESIRLNLFYWAYHNYIDDSLKKRLSEEQEALLIKIKSVEEEREAKAIELKESMDNDKEVCKIRSDTIKRMF